MDPRPHSRWTRSRIALALLAWIAALGLTEFAVGRWLQSPSTAYMSREFGLLQTPGARVVQSLEGWSVHRANRDGLFDDDLRAPRAAYRVLLMGDSYSEALQIDQPRNFAAAAERSAPDLEVVNAAQSGLFPAFYAAYAPRFVARYQPDLLVVQVGDGDIDEMADPARLQFVRDEVGGHPLIPYADTLAVGARERVRRVVKQSALIKYLSIRLALMERFERQRFARKFHGPPPVAPPEASRARATVVFDSLLAELRGEAPRVMLLYITQIDYFHDPPRVTDAWRRALIRDCAQRAGVPLVDPSEALLEDYRRTHQPLHGFGNSRIGFGHPNARGHAIIGRALGDAIAALRAEARVTAAPATGTATPGGAR